ncbi:MAG: DUF368 domain-containing protein [Pseudomonadales bacterium]
MSGSPSPFNPLLVFLKGMAMGAADVVPGVSGGTIALVSGIYQRLLGSLSRADTHFVGLVLKARLVEAWRYVDAQFLLTLMAGILTSIVLLAGVIGWLLVNQALLVWSFFFGLIAASAVYLWRSVGEHTVITSVLMLLGIVIAVVIAMAKPAELEMTNVYLIFCGALAICAMILPGISGSFILLLLGAYSYVLGAVRALDITVLALFGVGCVVGLLLFSRLLNWLISHHHDRIMALLTGFLAGSLTLVWPWKIVTQWYTSSHGEAKPLVQHNVLPSTWELQYTEPANVAFCVLLMLCGACLLLAIELWAGGRQKSK